MQILVGPDKVALVDDNDFDLVRMYTWHYVGKTGAVNGLGISMHRMLMSVTDPKVQVDHKNRNHLDNRRSNLRLASNTQNHQNRSAQGNVGNVSGIRGVAPHGDRWRAYASVDGKRHHVGVFDTKEQAAEVVSAFRREHMPYSVCDQSKGS